MKKRISQKKGFTLIELLVVITIIGLLASVVIANLSTSKQRATNAATIQNARSFQLSLALYFDANKGAGYPNPAAMAKLYCIGGSSCTNPYGGAAITDYLTQAPSTRDNFFAFLKPAIAEAANYNSGSSFLKQFSRLATPLVYECTTNANPCPSGSALVWYSQTTGLTTTWYVQRAGEFTLGTISNQNNAD